MEQLLQVGVDYTDPRHPREKSKCFPTTDDPAPV